MFQPQAILSRGAVLGANHAEVLAAGMGAHDRDAAQRILRRYVETAKVRSADTIAKIEASEPKDAIVRGSALEFKALLEKPSNRRAVVEVSRPFRANVHDNFLSQIADKGDVTMAYLRDLANVDAQWARDLSAHVLNTHAANVLSNGRYLVRGEAGANGTPGTLKAFLSDKFRRIDCRPGLQALIASAQEAGAHVTDAILSDTRASVRVILPGVYEVAPGEFVAVGLSWSNSDFGRGAQSLSLFIIRVWCLNGATMETELRQVHLGARLSDDVSYSDRTRRLDAAATTSAIRDASRELLSAGRVERTVDVLASAARDGIDAKARFADLRKRLGKGLADKIAEVYNGADVEFLPPGNTAWRLSNAISWVAAESEAEDRLDLERAAGDALKRAA